MLWSEILCVHHIIRLNKRLFDSRIYSWALMLDTKTDYSYTDCEKLSPDTSKSLIPGCDCAPWPESHHTLASSRTAQRIEERMDWMLPT